MSIGVIWQAISHWIAGGIALVVFAHIYKFIYELLAYQKNEETGQEHRQDRDRIASFLNEGAWQAYKFVLNWLIGRLDALFGRALFFGRAFSMCFFLALIYPVVFVMFGWAFFSGPGQLGTLEIFDSSAAPVFRILSFFVLLLYAFIILYGPIFFGRWFSKKGAFAIACAYSVAFGIAFSIVDAGAGTFAFAVAAAVFVAFAFTGVGSYTYIVAAGGVSILFILFLLSNGISSPQLRVLAVFFLALPAANGLLDWLSWGASRYFMRVIAKDVHWFKVAFHVLIDFLLGILFLLALTYVSVFLLEWVKMFTGDNDFDWRNLAATAVANPLTKGIAISLMLFTTLFPTALHLFTGIFALVATPWPWRKWFILTLTKNGQLTNMERHAIAFYLTLFGISSLVVLFAVFASLFHLIGLAVPEPLGQTLYDYAECAVEQSSEFLNCVKPLLPLGLVWFFGF